MDEKQLWWGYKHTNGSFQVKRFFSQSDLDDAYESPFASRVFHPFYAKDRAEALQHVQAADEQDA